MPMEASNKIWPVHLRGCCRLGTSRGGGVRGRTLVHGAWFNKMAGTPTGVWQIEDVHGGVRGRTWVPMEAWSNKMAWTSTGVWQIGDVYGGVWGEPAELKIRISD